MQIVWQAWDLNPVSGSPSEPVSGAGVQGPGDLHFSFWGKVENQSFLWAPYPPQAENETLETPLQETLKFHHLSNLQWKLATFLPFSLASVTIRPKNNSFDILKLSGHLPESERTGWCPHGLRTHAWPMPSCVHFSTGDRLRTGLAVPWTEGHTQHLKPAFPICCWTRPSQMPYWALSSVEPAAVYKSYQPSDSLVFNHNSCVPQLCQLGSRNPLNTGLPRCALFCRVTQPWSCRHEKQEGTGNKADSRIQLLKRKPDYWSVFQRHLPAGGN